jgi:uncharacterized membrane protein
VFFVTNSMVALVLLAVSWVLVRSLVMLHQARLHSDEARLARGFLAELRRRGLVEPNPLNLRD